MLLENMLLEKNDIQLFSKEILNFIEEQKIGRISDLNKLIEADKKRYELDKDQHFIELSTSDKKYSIVFNLSYIITDCGVPFELKSRVISTESLVVL